LNASGSPPGNRKKIEQSELFQVHVLRRCILSAFILFVATNFNYCSAKKAAPPNSAVLLESVAEADPQKYPSATKQWSNPYLVIRAAQIGLLSNTAPNEEQVLKPEEVLNALAQLPGSAWPYGRAVAILVDEKSAGSEQEKVALRRNRGIVEGDLDGAHVAIQWMGGE
jgi:hypothetical protein